MNRSAFRFFFFSYIITYENGRTAWGNKFVKHPTLPPFDALDEQIKKDTPEGDTIASIFYLNWKELSMADWMNATGQVPSKVQPAKQPLIKSLK